MCVLLILSIVLTISSVSAIEDNGIALDEIDQNNQDVIEEVEINEGDALSDSGIGDGDVLGDSPVYTFNDLDNKIRSATGANVTISGTYKYDPNKDGHPIGIKIEKNNNFTIIGNNLVIDGSGFSRGFNIQPQYAGYITLYNITFINFNHKDGNGGAVFSSMPLNISHCRFENNSADIGGAIYTYITYNSEYQSVLEFSTFINNSATSNCSAVYWQTCNNDYLVSNNFTNHNNNNTIFKFAGHDSALAEMNFVNNSAKICLDVIGDNNKIQGDKCSNNTGISLHVIGNNTQFGGNCYNNTDLSNDDYAIVIIGDRASFGGVNVYSPKSLYINGSDTTFPGCNFYGDVICHGNISYAGGFKVYGDLTVDGDALDFYGCTINGTFISNGLLNIVGTTVGKDLILNNDSQISGTFNKVVNYGNLNVTYGNVSDLINNGGVVNLNTYNLTGCNLTNNGGKILQIDYLNAVLDNCSIVNNGGELKFNGTRVFDTNIKNSKGTVDLMNCIIVEGKIENYDVLNIDDCLIVYANLVNNKGTANIRNVPSALNVSIDNKAKMNIQGSNLTNCSLINSGELSVSNDTEMDGLVIKKVDTTVTATKVTMYYGAGKKITIKITDKSGNPVKNTKFTVTINKKKYYATSNAKGIATVKIPVLKVGSYKVTVKGAKEYYNIKNIQTTVKVNKAKTTVKMAKSVKKSKKYKITIKSKVTKKAVSKVKIKVKVYTGKKVKTFKIKTNKKGIAKLSTRKLAKGKHKIIVSSLNKNYKISKKTTFKIK